MFLAFGTALGCGSGAADVDAAVTDATVDDSPDNCVFCVDAQPDTSNIQPQIVCPDAGYSITIDGDGAEQTLSNVLSYFIDCCGYQAVAIVGLKSLDGGAGLRLEQASSETPDGGLVPKDAGQDYAGYWRPDGSVFAAPFDASLTTSYTQLGPPGSIVAGSYAVTVSAVPDGGTLSLSGAFVSCRTGDMICVCPPPPHP